jgi:hypothetical protein
MGGKMVPAALELKANSSTPPLAQGVKFAIVTVLPFGPPPQVERRIHRVVPQHFHRERR